MSFGIALTGIDAAQTDLNVVSNNIANANTTGFKQSVAEFSGLYASSQNGVAADAVGSGVQVAAIAQDFSQGSVQTTGNNLNLAISGQGFFTVSNGGALSYTRAGDFSTNADGFVVNPQGQVLQVYAPTANGGFNTSTTTGLQIAAGDSAPVATQNVNLTLDLPANAAVPVDPVFAPTDVNSYNNSTTATVYDSLGAAHTATVYFAKTAAANQWNAYLTVDGQTVGAAQALTFSANGALTTPANGAIAFGPYAPTTGAGALTMNFNLSKTTQYGDAFAVSSIQQDGFTTGTLSGINIDTAGVVEAQYTNGQSVQLGQVALASFANPDGLAQLGNSDWGQTGASGQALNGQAGTAGLGQVESGSLEESNVDVTAQLVAMITAQRAFQANAQMISTQNQITQTVIQIPTQA
ncbi:MAG: flagellar hook protein FlgE [Steroidobacteraceae bacterium]|jgi:flagellar hook protein FlgE